LEYIQLELEAVQSQLRLQDRSDEKPIEQRRRENDLALSILQWYRDRQETPPKKDLVSELEQRVKSLDNSKEEELNA